MLDRVSDVAWVLFLVLLGIGALLTVFAADNLMRQAYHRARDGSQDALAELQRQYQTIHWLSWRVADVAVLCFAVGFVTAPGIRPTLYGLWLSMLH